MFLCGDKSDCLNIACEALFRQSHTEFKLKIGEYTQTAHDNLCIYLARKFHREAAIARHFDIGIIDTAGRLHTRYNLMEELKKVHRVVGKAMPGAPHMVWLVMDATTGQNALQQARAFKEAVNVTGVILAKLDSSARGGMAFAIQKELGLPILFAGLGENSDDLQPFDPDLFIQGIVAGKE